MKKRNERYNRDRLISITSDLVTQFRLPSTQEENRMRVACRHLADALDRLSGPTLQQRWNQFEKKIWPKWAAGIGRPSELWTWGARVLVPTSAIVQSTEWLHDLRVNQWIVRLPEMREAWGNSLRARGALTLSVLGTCFTKQTGDMVYTMAENSWLSQLWLDA